MIKRQTNFTFLVTVMFCGLVSINSWAQGWQASIVTQLPESVSNNAVCGGEVNGNRMAYSFYGIDSTKTHQGIHLKSYKVNLETGVVTTLPTVPDTLGKIAASASFVGGKIYIMGGYHVYPNGREASSNKVHIFDTQTDSFLPDGEPIPVATDDHVQLVKDNRYIYLISGWSDVKNIPDVQVYDTETNTWQVGTPTPNNGFFTSFGASGTMIGDTILYYGGASSSIGFKPQAFLRKGIIDPKDRLKITWTYEIIDPNTNCYRCGSFHVNKKAFWIGGSSDTYNYNGRSYRDNSGVEPQQMLFSLEPEKEMEFTKVFNVAAPMDLRGVVQFGTDVYTIGGMVENQKVSNEVIQFKLKKGVSTTYESHTTHVAIWPNPAGKIVNITPLNEIESAYFIATNGQQFDLTQSLQKPTINIAHLPPGFYTVVIKTTNQQHIVHKIAVVRD